MEHAMWHLKRARDNAIVATAVATSWVVLAEAIELRLPIDCEVGRTCEIQKYVDLDPSPNVRDYQCGTLADNGHKGIDFRLPSLHAQRAGVDVLAAAAGRVLRVRDGVADVSVRERGIGAVEGRECGNGVVIDHGDGWNTQYCHMAQGSVTVKPGEVVQASQRLGRVGMSGLAEYPHLHFGVTFQGDLVEPFAFEAPQGSCGAGRSLWEPSLQAALAYKPRALLNTGFTDRSVEMQAIENEELVAPTRESPLVAYVRAIGAKAGDIQRLAITGPDGRIVAENSAKPLDRDKAQVMVFVGKKAPPGGWPSGVYRAAYTITAGRTVVLERAFTKEF
jgi:murein DD-endopeptidase MepM/ murein hydrolase activator NlpD